MGVLFLGGKFSSSFLFANTFKPVCAWTNVLTLEAAFAPDLAFDFVEIFVFTLEFVNDCESDVC